MADWILVRLGRDTAQPHQWACVAVSGHLSEAPGSGDDQALLSAAEGRRVALVVPGSEVLQTLVVVPAGSESRQAQIIPYALEDQVAEDLESLHFAAGKPIAGPGSALCVDVVSRELLQSWLDAAAAIGLQPQALMADSQLLPLTPGGVTLLLAHETVTVVRADARPAVLPASELGLALDIALGADNAQWAATSLVVYASSQDWLTHAPMIEALRPSLASLKVQLLSAGTLPLLAGQLPAQTAINLLQGDFVQRQSAAVAWQAWRWAAGFAAALLVVHWAGQALTLRQLKMVERALDQRIEQMVASALPGEVAAANGARARMQTRLDQLRASADDGQGLLPLLVSVAAGRAGAPGTQLQSLAFRRGSLDLTFNGPDAGSIEQINQSLRGAGLSSELTAGAVHGSDYQGRLQVRTGGK